MAERLAIALLTVTADGHILTANPVGEAVLGRGDGLISANGRLTAVSCNAASRLASAIRTATASRQPGATSALVERDSDKPAYHVTAPPVNFGSGIARAMVVFRDPDFIDPTLSDRLRSLFGLTEAEAAIAVKLGERRSPAEIIAERGVRSQTLSGQMKSILSKMGCRRQAEVAAIVAALPPLSLAVSSSPR